ncbi:hydrogenase maturation protease [Phaeovulum sp.]|uniref:hydrogenase maturation protease n=1 Tax=Phaeovulum sp. TaxID=2934796 RepID=UPI002AC8DFFB|nr:hydrogenase maturation protease [Phaeovulum sp.]
MPAPRVLLIGYGNPGRGDDGLGPALADAIAALCLSGVTVQSDYQLMVDHSALIAEHDVVVFADAMIGLDAPYRFSRIAAAEPELLGTHQVSPEAALTLARLLFGHAPPGWMLAIAGDEFGEVKEGLGGHARGNLGLAVDFLQGWLACRFSGDLVKR